jgi:hypothetical protein
MITRWKQATPFVLATILLLCAGCGGSSERPGGASSSGAIAIKTLLDNPSDYNDKTVRIGGAVESSMGAFGKGAYNVDDGTGTLTVLAGEGDTPREGTRVEVEGEFESIFTLGSDTGAVLKESKRTPRE